MRWTLDILAVAALMTVSAGAQAACPAIRTINIVADANGKTIVAHPGDTLRVVLSGPSGTGYVWQMLPNGTAALATAGVPAPRAPSARPGAPAGVVFLLQAARPGQQVLRFEFRRPWEKGTPAARTFTVTIDVAAC